ncbi:MAG: hypothetical protein ACOX9E_11955, partial [Lentisphaeria bacterium]
QHQSPNNPRPGIPAVLRACSPQRDMTPQTAAKRACFPAGMFCAFSAENQRGDRKTQTHRPSYTKQPTLKKICANRRNLRIKNVCYQSVTGYAFLPAAFIGAVALLVVGFILNGVLRGPARRRRAIIPSTSALCKKGHRNGRRSQKEPWLQ